MGRLIGSLMMVLMLSLAPLVQVHPADPQGPDGASSSAVDPEGIPGPDLDSATLLSAIDGFFTENLGQLSDPDARFYAIGRPLSVAFGRGWVSYRFCPSDGDGGVLIRVDFVGSNPVEPEGVDPTRHRSSFFRGNDPGDWVTTACAFEEVLYPGLYDGIDLRYYFLEGRLKYDFVVRPNADPAVVALEYDGIKGLEVDSGSGDLVIRTDVGCLMDEAPRTFSVMGTAREPVKCAYRLLGDDVVGFDVAAYERGSTLVIDPGLNFSTYIGGTSNDVTNLDHPVRVDAEGNVLLASSTESDDFPTTAGAYCTTLNDDMADLVVLKLSKDGKDLLFSTYIGGVGSERSLGLTIDPDGGVLVSGWTQSDDFPVTNRAYQTRLAGTQDGFFLKLGSNGTELEFSTLLGGSNGTAEEIHSIEVDANGDYYLIGNTPSTDFPVTNGSFDTSHNGGVDVYIVKMDRNATDVLLGTYVGGSGTDDGIDLGILGDAIYAAGGTTSDDLPTTNGSYCQDYQGGTEDAYIVSIDMNLSSLDFLTYLGGSDQEEIFSTVCFDEEGNPFFGGWTHSSDFPTTAGAYDRTYDDLGDGFIVKLNASGDRLLRSTFYGGNDEDFVMDLAVDASGSLVFFGDSQSDDLPVTDNAYDYTPNGEFDLHVGRFDTNLTTLEYCTYVGGSDVDNTGMKGLAHGPTNTTIVGVTSSRDFPTTVGAYQRQLAGGDDIYVVRLVTDPPSSTELPSEPMNLTAQGWARLVYLTWDEPIETGDLRIRGYNIYRGFSDQDLELLTTHTSIQTLAYMDDPVTNGRTYYYAVTAFNMNGEGPRSAVVNVTPFGPPGIPTNLTASPGCASVSLTWRAPIDTGGFPILGYRLHRGASIVTIGHYLDLGNVTSFVDTGLTNGRTYYYKVQAFTEMANGTNTSHAFARPMGLPSEPMTVNATAGNGFVLLRWRAPLDDGGAQVLGYRILRGRAMETLLELTTLVGEAKGFNDTDVVNGVEYRYSLQAFSVVGNGSMSAIVRATPRGPPGAPTMLDIIAGNGEAALSWERPAADGGSPVLGYRVYRGEWMTQRDRLVDLDVDTYYFKDTNLTNGQTYYYWVAAYNAVGQGAMAGHVTATPFGVPDEPQGVAVEAGMGYLTVEWEPPEDDGGSPITSYIVYRGGSADSLQPFVELGPSTLTYDDVAVVVGTEYHYAVIAVTDGGEGLMSRVQSAVPTGLPGAPGDLTAFPSDGEVFLSWNVPENTGALPITGYIVLRGGHPDLLTELTRLGPRTNLTDSKVENGMTYHYSVAAVNDLGTGPFAEVVQATPLGPPTEPGAVRTLKGTLRGAKVTLTWTPPESDGGAEIVSYVVLRGLSPYSLKPVAELGAELTYTDEGLDRGTNYYYSVVAVNGVGTSEPVTAIQIVAPKQQEDGPGFPATIALLAMAGALMFVLRRRP